MPEQECDGRTAEYSAATASRNMALDGNVFSALSILQNAQLHLMKPSAGVLPVSLDGDYAASLRLQSAVGDLLSDSMNKYFSMGYDKSLESSVA